MSYLGRVLAVGVLFLLGAQSYEVEILCPNCVGSRNFLGGQIRGARTSFPTTPKMAEDVDALLGRIQQCDFDDMGFLTSVSRDNLDWGIKLWIDQATATEAQEAFEALERDPRSETFWGRWDVGQQAFEIVDQSSYVVGTTVGLSRQAQL